MKMGSGKVLGEERRRAGGPNHIVEPGQHNRKARRAAAASKPKRATKKETESAADVEMLAKMWEAFAEHQRNRVTREFDETAQKEYDLEEWGQEWPSHIPPDWVMDKSEEYAEEYAKLTDSEFSREGSRVGLLLAGPDGAPLCDQARGGSSPEALDAMARAIALGSIAPGGIKIWGIHATYT